MAGVSVLERGQTRRTTDQPETPQSSRIPGATKALCTSIRQALGYLFFVISHPVKVGLNHSYRGSLQPKTFGIATRSKLHTDSMPFEALQQVFTAAMRIHGSQLISR